MLVDYSKRRAETTNDETNDGNLYRRLQVSPHWSQQRTKMERQIQAAELAASNEGPDELLQLARPPRRSLSPYQRCAHPNRTATLRERSCSWDISSRYLPENLDDAEEEEEGSGDVEDNRPFPMDWSQPSQRTSTVAEKSDKEKLLSLRSWITKAANTLEEDSSMRSLNMVVPSRTTKTKEEETTSNAKGSLSLSEIQKDCNSISSLSFEMRRRPNPVKQPNEHSQDDNDDVSLCSAASARIRQSLLLQEPLNTLTRSRSMGMGAVTNSTSPVHATTTKRRALSPGNSTSHVRHRSLSPCHYYSPPSFQKEPQQDIPHKILLDFNASFASTKHTDWEDQSHSSRRSSRRSSRASRQSKKDYPPAETTPTRQELGHQRDPQDDSLPNMSSPPIALTIPRPGALTLQQRQSSTEVQPGNLSDDNSIASSLDEESDDSCTGAPANFARQYTTHCPRKNKLPRRSLSVGANNHNYNNNNNNTGLPLNILLSPTTATLRRSLSVDEPRRSSLSSSESSSKRRPRRISRTKSSSSSSKRGSLLLHKNNNPNNNNTGRDSVRRCNSFVTGSRIRRHNNNDGTTTMDQPKGHS